MGIKTIINYLKIHRSEICFVLFCAFFIITGGFIESWQLIKAFISFAIAIVSFVIGTLWLYKEN